MIQSYLSRPLGNGIPFYGHRPRAGALGKETPKALILEDLRFLGQDATTSDQEKALTGSVLTLVLVSLASAGVSAYHGYKRSRGSISTAAFWGLGGLLFPVLIPIIALTQGFAKPERR